MREVEVKLAVSDPSAVERRLARLGARFEGESEEENHLVAWRGRLLRIRFLRGAGALLTYKGPVEPSRYKRRTERELRLGEPWSRWIRSFVRREPDYRKRRRLWTWGEVEVSLDLLLDETERGGRGRYIEIEGRGEDAVDRAVRALALTHARVVRSSYPAIAARWRQGRPPPRGTPRRR